jgi:hypothetical protein
VSDGAGQANSSHCRESIVTFELDWEITWTVHGRFDFGHAYGYRLEQIQDGTLVKSCYDWSAAGQAWKDVGTRQAPVGIPAPVTSTRAAPCAQRRAR